MYRTDSVVLQGFSASPRHGAPGVVDSTNVVRLIRPTIAPADAFFEVGAARFDRSRGMDAASLLMMGSAFEAGYLLTDTLAAQTRFVITLPTRNAYLDDLVGG